MLRNNKLCMKIFSACLAILLLTLLSIDIVRVKRSEASVLGLPEPGAFVEVSKDYSAAKFVGMRFDPKEPSKMEFILDPGSSQKNAEDEVYRLMNYFLAALTVSEKDLWVNLSPYEKDRIMSEELSKTDLGKDLLSQDYLLKQLSSSLTKPDTKLGKDYWRYVESTGQSALGKIWISPDHIAVYQEADSVFITASKLKVEVENKDSALALKFLIDEISDDVNYGKNFANLRQLYNSVILASWFKSNFVDSVYEDYFDKSKIAGIELKEKNLKEEIWSLYCESLDKGTYKLHKKQKVGNKLIRKQYFAGGVQLFCSSSLIKKESNLENFSYEGLKRVSFENEIIESDSLHEICKTFLEEINVLYRDNPSGIRFDDVAGVFQKSYSDKFKTPGSVEVLRQFSKANLKDDNVNSQWTLFLDQYKVYLESALLAFDPNKEKIFARSSIPGQKIMPSAWYVEPNDHEWAKLGQLFSDIEILQTKDITEDLLVQIMDKVNERLVSIREVLPDVHPVRANVLIDQWIYKFNQRFKELGYYIAKPTYRSESKYVLNNYVSMPLLDDTVQKLWNGELRGSSVDLVDMPFQNPNDVTTRAYHWVNNGAVVIPRNFHDLWLDVHLEQLNKLSNKYSEFYKKREPLLLKMRKRYYQKYVRRKYNVADLKHKHLEFVAVHELTHRFNQQKYSQNIKSLSLTSAPQVHTRFMDEALAELWALKNLLIKENNIVLYLFYMTDLVGYDLEVVYSITDTENKGALEEWFDDYLKGLKNDDAYKKQQLLDSIDNTIKLMEDEYAQVLTFNDKLGVDDIALKRSVFSKTEQLNENSSSPMGGINMADINISLEHSKSRKRKNTNPNIVSVKAISYSLEEFF